MRAVFSIFVLLALASSGLMSKAIAVEQSGAQRLSIAACCGPVDKPIDPD